MHPDPTVLDPDDPTWRRPPASTDERRADGLLAAALLVGAVLSQVLTRMAGMSSDPASAPVSLTLLALECAPLALRRRYPSAVAVLVTVAFIANGTLRVPEYLISNIALFIALYSIGAWEPRRSVATWARFGVSVVMIVWLVIWMFQLATEPEVSAALHDSLGTDVPEGWLLSPMVAYALIQVLTNILYFAGAYYFGDHAWRSARERARTQLRGVELQTERRRLDAQAVTIERMHLARELHDAVAHHVSLMGVQAAAARSLLDLDVRKASTSLAHVENAAREAVHELRGLITTLRDQPGAGEDGHGLDEAIASLGVDRLGHLVAESQLAGVTTDLTIVGAPRPLPPLVSLNLYRVAQEALTNVRKHAGPRPAVDVRLRYLADAVELEVANTSSRPFRTPTSGGHLGILGMRERVTSDGGTLHAAPRGRVGRDRGGFVVRARVPLSAPTSGALHV